MPQCDKIALTHRIPRVYPVVVEKQNVTKRKRGAQPGNRNARTHGFYTFNLTEAEALKLCAIPMRDVFDPSIAVARIKLDSIVQQDPVNPRAVLQIARDIAEVTAAKSHMEPEDVRFLASAIRVVIEQRIAITHENKSEKQNESGSSENSFSNLCNMSGTVKQDLNL
jgi:hypothetical protein